MAAAQDPRAIQDQAKARLAALPPHPARRLVTVFYAFAGVFAVLGALTVAVGGGAAATLLLLMVPALALLARRLRENIQAVTFINTSVQHVSRGEIEEAKVLLGLVEPKAAKRNIMRRASETLRAMIALYEGRAEEAASRASAAIAGRPSIFAHGFESAQIASAHSWRGLAHAAMGEGARANEDAEAAEASAHAAPDVIARARLVRLLVLARAGEHDALAKNVTSSARLILERALPRERALFRALRRLSRSPKRSVYREPSRPMENEAPSKLASWIETMAPDAASFVDGEALFAERSEDTAPTSEVMSDVRALDRAKWAEGKNRPNLGRRVLLLWALLIVMFLTVWQFLTPPPRPGRVATTPAPPVAQIDEDRTDLVVPGAAAGAFAVVFGLLLARGRRLERRFALARRSAAMGEPRSVPELALLTKKNNMIIAASAELELARIANDQGDFGEAISRCDNGIGRLQGPMMRAASGDLLLPALMAESAVAAAARGGREEADAKIAFLARDFATYPWLAAAHVRVRLLNAVRGNDTSGAIAAARARTAEMPIPLHEDVLADLILAANVGVSDDEKARLEGELRDDERLRAWIELVAPGLRDRALSSGKSAPVRVVETDENGRTVPKAYAEVDAEARAEAEADADPGAVAKKMRLV